MEYKIEYENNPTSEDLHFLASGISNEASIQRGLAAIESYGFFFRDETGKILGGLSGWMYYGCIYIDMLYIDALARGKGYGRSLMKAAEELGKSKQCAFAAVNTMDWEAKPFYENLGYHVEFERKGFDRNSVAYFLRKNL